MTRAGLPTLLLRFVVAAALVVFGAPSHAAYSCSVTATPISALITMNWLLTTSQDVTGSATVTCTRASSDANTLGFWLKATDGLNSDGSSPYRRVRRGSASSYMDYYLRREATCANSTNWRATDAANAHTGSMSFGSSLVASVAVPYCVRFPTAYFPTAGHYTDTFEIYVQYPGNNAGAISPSASVPVTAGLGEQCVFHTYPGNMVFNYTAFSATTQTASTSFMLRCNSSTPWSISVSPAIATLLGLRYQVSASPTSGSGNNSGQAVTLTGTMQAGQAGTCTTGVCNATQSHTVTIEY